MTAALGRGRAIVAALLLCALVVPLGRAALGAPVLRSATATHGQVIVTFTVVDLRPGSIEIAASRATDAFGRFLAKNVRLREAVTAREDPATGLVRWRTTRRLPPRVYFVEVSGVESDGVTDCLPQLRDCLVRWSNVRRVLVR